jgi:hypothetical protein
MQERVSRAEAARQIGVDKSTITRLVKDNPALLDDAGHVSVSEIAQLRHATVNPKLQTRTGKQNPVPDFGEVRALNGARGRAETAKAEMAEMNLAERLGQTLRRDDVEIAVAAAGNLLRQNAFAVARDRAEILARIDDPREMERALEDLMREVLEKGVQALALAVAPTETASAA